MHKQLRRMATAGAILAFLTAMPGLAWALGLGQIQSDTHIGQPLKARIPILVDNANDLQGLKVDLAEPDAYKQAGLQESDYLFTLDFQVKQGAQGPYVLVTSSQPVKSPFLNLMVRARWTSGQVTRQYTLLLNPPVFANKGQQGGGAQTQPAVSEPSGAQRSQPAPPRPQNANRPATPPGRTQTLQAHSYGPVQHGDTLWGIANRLHSGTGLSVNQMMIAIYRANPQAFSGNINRLKSGAELHVPSQTDIANISRHAATSEVVNQNQSWQSAQAPSGNEEVAEQPSNGSVSGQKQPASQGNETSTAQRNAAGENTHGSTGEGEVVLTAPTVTQSPAAATAGEQTAANAMAGSAATAAAAGAAVAAGGARGGPSGEQGNPNPNAPAAAASSGGPLKAHNAELAALAGQATSRGGETANTTGEEKPAAGTPAEHEAAASNSADTVNTTDTDAAGGPVMDWLTSPKGWIVLILIIILLTLITYFLIRRRQGGTALTAAERAEAEPYETDEAHYPEEEALVPETGAAHAEDSSEEEAATLTAEADETPADETVAAEPGEPDEDEGATDDEATETDEAALADALVEADFYAGSGDHAGAAASLAVALEHAPERNDLRLRRLEELHASAERDAFLTEAEVLHGQIPEDSADWQAVAVMGRQLLPAEPLFREGDEAVADTPEAATDEEATLDVDRELDRLTNTEPVRGLQDDFEHTLGELSTMIETYMPEDGMAGDELQSPPEQGTPEAVPSTLEKEAQPSADEDDDVLEFEPQILPEQTSGAPDSETEGEPVPPAEEFSGSEETPQAPPSDDASIDLELARSYIDMGDNESARGVLEDVLASGDPAARDHARQLLDDLEAGNVSTPLEFTEEAYETSAIDSDGPTAAGDEAGEEETAEESGTMLDLARAYIEMGDQESARDVLEEILDKGEAGETERARELLDSM